MIDLVQAAAPSSAPVRHAANDATAGQFAETLDRVSTKQASETTPPHTAIEDKVPDANNQDVTAAKSKAQAACTEESPPSEAPDSVDNTETPIEKDASDALLVNIMMVTTPAPLPASPAAVQAPTSATTSSAAPFATGALGTGAPTNTLTAAAFATESPSTEGLSTEVQPAERMSAEVQRAGDPAALESVNDTLTSAAQAADLALTETLSSQEVAAGQAPSATRAVEEAVLDMTPTPLEPPVAIQELADTTPTASPDSPAERGGALLAAPVASSTASTASDDEPSPNAFDEQPSAPAAAASSSSASQRPIDAPGTVSGAHQLSGAASTNQPPTSSSAATTALGTSALNEVWDVVKRAAVASPRLIEASIATDQGLLSLSAKHANGAVHVALSGEASSNLDAAALQRDLSGSNIDVSVNVPQRRDDRPDQRTFTEPAKPATEVAPTTQRSQRTSIPTSQLDVLA
jgi:hypothetical protein